MLLTLGDCQITKINVNLITLWHGGILQSSATHGRAKGQRKQTVTAKARCWAKENGLQVASTGRLSPKIIAAYQQAETSLPKSPARTAGKTAAAHAYRFVRQVLNAAKREGLIIANPADIPGAGSGQSAKVTPATVTEIKIITANMPDYLAASIPVATWAALRFGEVFALERQHVTIYENHLGTITGAALKIMQAVEQIPGQTTRIGAPKTRASIRTVNLPPSAAQILANHLQRFTGPKPADLVFTTSTGKIVESTYCRRHFVKARAAAQRNDLRFHDLRHTGATMATKAGASLTEIMARLGHTTPRAALIYQHTDQDADKALANKLEKLLGAEL
jgi:integrase